MNEEELKEVEDLLSSAHTFLHEIWDDLPNDRSKSYIKEAIRNIELAEKEVNNCDPF